MKVLFDQNVPHKLRTTLTRLTTKHEIFTAAYMGWRELATGELLRMAEANGIELFVTGDATLRYEQNSTRYRLAIVSLSSDNWPILKDHIPAILDAIDSAKPGSFQTVECGRSNRKHED